MTFLRRRRPFKPFRPGDAVEWYADGYRNSGMIIRLQRSFAVVLSRGGQRLEKAFRELTLTTPPKGQK